MRLAGLVMMFKGSMFARFAEASDQLRKNEKEKNVGELLISRPFPSA